jgi:hypothetical protein
MNFGSYEIILMCCVVTTVVMVILLRDIGPYVFYLNFGWLVIICCYGILGFMGYVFICMRVLL